MGVFGMYKFLGAAATVAMLVGCSTVQGVVRNKYTGTPVAAAVVTVDKSSTSTNGFGHYYMQGSFLPGDTMMVNASCYDIYTGSITSTSEIKDINLTPSCGNNNHKFNNNREHH